MQWKQQQQAWQAAESPLFMSWVQPEDEAECALLRILGRPRGSLHWFRARCRSWPDQLADSHQPAAACMLRTDRRSHAMFMSRSSDSCCIDSGHIIPLLARGFLPHNVVPSPRALRPGIETASDAAPEHGCRN